MFDLKKQIRTLYITGILGNLSITGAWVAILSARGFSLVQIGFAETIFHITSLICEIPSGMFADMYGRKKMLVISNIMAVTGDLIMGLTSGFAGVCLAMPFHAMNYNFASGSGDALAFDSMKSVKKEAGFERYVSTQSVIYRVASGLSTLCAGLALLIGYRAAYLISAAMGLLTLVFTFSLKEIRVKDEEGDPDENRQRRSDTGRGSWRNVFKALISYFTDSILFLMKNKKASALMFLNSFVGAVDILLLFFLESKLQDAGLTAKYLGIGLFIMQMGGVVGSKLILKAEKVRYVIVFFVCVSGVIAGVLLEHSAIVWLMVFGGFISSMSDDAIQIRTDAKLNGMFPSEQRATLISISSFTFSVIMIVMSPLAGYFFSIW
ncbi:MAG TPA: MFS transporter [Lachnospiraceae bacterium]|nr:MFS transporter [Lachnospiraceae bacterium]